LAVPTLALAQDAPPEDVQAYAVGYEAGLYILDRIEADGVEFDIDALLAGLEDALRGSPARLSESRIRMLLQRLADEVRGREAAAMLESDPVFRALAEDNKRRGDEYRKIFSETDGVVALDNGVQYEVLTTGAGTSPTMGNTVRVTFDAETIDGARFAVGRDVEMVIDDLFDGAREVLQRMKPGDRWIVVFPPEQAFGLAGRGGEVGPNETIVADIELLGVGESE
jgi:FKBP-type peptidyl-prolyl cis-trans isomerase FklB